MNSKQHKTSVVCPVCQGEMNVKELDCPDCNISVRGDFGPISLRANASISRGIGSRFDKLTGDQMNFLETFLRCRGIIRDVEAALGISYPTVRARLDSLLATLNLGAGSQAEEKRAEAAASEAAQPATDKPSIKDILAKLDSGNMNAQAALDALRGSSDTSN